MTAKKPARKEPVALLSVGPMTEGAFGLVAAASEDDHSVHMTYTNLPGPWTYEITGEFFNGKAAITRLTIAPRDPAAPVPITRDTIRRAPVGLLLDRVRS